MKQESEKSKRELEKLVINFNLQRQARNRGQADSQPQSGTM